MSDQDTFLDALVKVIKRVGSYNTNDQVPPAAILWPDKDRQWENLLPLLREHLPLFTLGDYKPEERTGPSYWLRCVVAGTLPQHRLPPGTIPIIYLPGISKQEIRAIEDTPRILQPLAELQYRGVLWTQRNGRDWTVSAFLQSANGGLGITVSADTATRAALHRALLKLVDEPIVRLKKEAPLRAGFFDALLHPDKVRNLLLWLNDATGYPKRCTADEWAAFCHVCQSEYGFNPEKEGIMTAMTLLGEHRGVWEIVWNRFKDAPYAYPHLPELLRSARPSQPSLFEIEEAWPQDNEAAELALQKELISLRTMSSDQMRTTIAELEQEHAIRRTWVWATLGKSPLAVALQHLVILARETERILGGTTIAEIVAAYTTWGWKADAAAIDAVRVMEHANSEDVNAMKTAVTLLYRPWLERSATAIQKLISADHLTQTYAVEHLTEPDNSTCILFSDGLRYDVGQRLVAALESQELTCSVASHLAALPPITATAKPAISPVAKLLSGRISSGLEVVVTASNTKTTIETLRKLLAQSGYQVLRDDELGDPSTKAWAEMGAIDRNGHNYGWKLVYHLQSEVEGLKRRIENLLNWGWKQVIVVTDHGWLLSPDSFPKAELPEHLTYMRKGRCAQLKESAHTDQQILPWYWNNNVQIAYAPNICCYEAGKEYEHGGLSPQECIVPMITVSKQAPTSQPVTFKKVSWRGLRCTINIAGSVQGIKVDIRSKAGDPKTSLLNAPKSPDADGMVSVLIEDEDRIGEAALIVALKSDGTISKQILVTIGG